MGVREDALIMWEEPPFEGFFKFFQNSFVAQKPRAKISRPTNFFAKDFMAPPITFSLLIKAGMCTKESSK